MVLHPPCHRANERTDNHVTIAVAARKEKRRCVEITRIPTAIFFSPLGCLLSVLVASHGQGGTAERPDARELLQAPAALALCRHARGLRTDAGGADDDTGDLQKQRTGW